jgi:hypothetical protein
MFLKTIKSYQSCDVCQHSRLLNLNDKRPLQLIMTLAPREVRLDFMGPIKPTTKYIASQYILVTTNYTVKWVKMKPLYDNTTKSTNNFLYEHIITHFGCFAHSINIQENYFINNIIKVLTTKPMIIHRKSTSYYP